MTKIITLAIIGLTLSLSACSFKVGVVKNDIGQTDYCFPCISIKK